MLQKSGLVHKQNNSDGSYVYNGNYGQVAGLNCLLRNDQIVKK